MEKRALEEAVSGAPVGSDGGERSGRLVSLDVFRGLCVAGMLLVTDPGTYRAIYPQLRHAEWRGGTAADMIFPGFLFAVGVATPLSLGARTERGVSRGAVWLGVLRRAVLLVVIGLVLNLYPTMSLATLRLPGILQRIGLCFLVSATVWLAMSAWEWRRRIVGVLAVGAGLLMAYGAVLLLVRVPGYGAGQLDPLRNLPGYVDRAVFTVPHMWPYGTVFVPGQGIRVTFDPEGLLSTLGAIASTLLGVATGEVLRWRLRLPLRILAALAGAGAGLIMAGLLLGSVMPIIKKIWTPSFAMVSSGMVLLAFLAAYWAIDLQGLRRGLTPLLVFGTNSIASFTLGGLVTGTLIAWRIGGTAAYEWIYERVFGAWLPARMGSLAYAFCVVAIECTVMWLLYRRRIFLRV